MDLAACAAVREAVGPDVPLMLDSYHYYNRTDALALGRGLEALSFHWFEEPMDEASMSSYQWLAAQLDIPIIGPETAAGKMYTRAEWIKNGACDITRSGVGDVGGLTPLMKCIHLAESFNMACEIHGGGPGNLNALGAMGIPGEFYERGLLHPFIDYEKPPEYLKSLYDPMDDEGYVRVPTLPGLGLDLDFDYIEANRVK
jgi:L-alanine-DL-glutamate epimerase-like enolase superfamily enzyme